MGITESIVQVTEQLQKDQNERQQYSTNNTQTQQHFQNQQAQQNFQINPNVPPINFNPPPPIETKQPPPPPPDDNNNIAKEAVTVEEEDWRERKSDTAFGSKAAWNDVPEKMLKESSGKNKYRSPKASKIPSSAVNQPSFMVPEAPIQNSIQN